MVVGKISEFITQKTTIVKLIWLYECPQNRPNRMDSEQNRKIQQFKTENVLGNKHPLSENKIYEM